MCGVLLQETESVLREQLGQIVEKDNEVKKVTQQLAEEQQRSESLEQEVDNLRAESSAHLEALTAKQV